MLHRTTIAAVAVAAAGAIGAAVLISSQGSSYGGSGASVSSGVVRTQTATVDGKMQTILTDARGMPLYYYAPDSPGTSRVSGDLATAWPPVTSTVTPTVSGVPGQISLVRDSHGSQVAYNGHLLYTFVSDHRGVVTGQGVENFFVATPDLAAAGGSSSSNDTGSASSYGGY